MNNYEWLKSLPLESMVDRILKGACLHCKDFNRDCLSGEGCYHGVTEWLKTEHKSDK